MLLFVIFSLLITNGTPTTDNKPHKRNNIRRHCNIFKPRDVQNTAATLELSISEPVKNYWDRLKIFKKCSNVFSLFRQRLKMMAIGDKNLKTKKVSNNHCTALNNIDIDTNHKQTDPRPTQSRKAIYMTDKERTDENKSKLKQLVELKGVMETSLFKKPKEQLMMGQLKSNHIYFSKEIDTLEKIHNDYILNFKFTKDPELKDNLQAHIQRLKEHISIVRSLLATLSDFIQQISQIDVHSDFASLLQIPHNKPSKRSDNLVSNDDFYYCYYRSKIYYKEVDIANNKVEVKSSLSLIKQLKVKHQSLDFSNLHLKKRECYLRTLLQLVFETTNIQTQILIDEQILKDYKKAFSIYNSKRQRNLRKVKRKEIHKSAICKIIDKIKECFGNKQKKKSNRM